MAQPTLRSHSCWLNSGQCCPLFPNQPSSPPHLCCGSRFRLSSRHCSHSLTECPSPISLGMVFSSACPQTTSPSWVGMPGTPGSLASWQDGRGFVQSRWESEAYCSQRPLFPLSLGAEGSDDRYPPCSPDQPAFGLHTHTHFPYRAFAGLPCSSSPYYQRTSVSSGPVLYHS